MVTVISSQAIAAGMQAFLKLIGGSGTLHIFDANDNLLGTMELPNPAGVVFDDVIVFDGFPMTITTSSKSPVGAIPAYASIKNGRGQTLVTGLPVISGGSGLVLSSSATKPGQPIGLISMQLTAV